MYGQRLHDNRHLQRLAESIAVNTGDPPRDDKGSEVKENARTLESPDAPGGSQSGHSTWSIGKLCTWGRATVLWASTLRQFLNGNTEVHLWMSGKSKED
jgi:hypothetical protein